MNIICGRRTWIFTSTINCIPSCLVKGRYHGKETLEEAEKLAWDKAWEDSYKLAVFYSKDISQATAEERAFWEDWNESKKQRHKLNAMKSKEQHHYEQNSCDASRGFGVPYQKANGECPTCHGKTINGKAQYTCSYSPLTCQHHGCDGSC